MTEQWAAALWQRFKDHYGQKWTALFQGPESVESWRITWSEIDADAEQIRYALGRISVEFSDWPPTFGQFKALCDSRKNVIALPAPKQQSFAPTKESLAELERVASKIGKRAEKWWVPQNVTTESQVSFIVMQARHFGEYSQAGRFLKECIDAGVITEYLKLAKNTDRQPGQDDEERAV